MPWVIQWTHNASGRQGIQPRSDGHWHAYCVLEQAEEECIRLNVSPFYTYVPLSETEATSKFRRPPT